MPGCASFRIFAVATRLRDNATLVHGRGREAEYLVEVAVSEPSFSGAEDNETGAQVQPGDLVQQARNKLAVNSAFRVHEFAKCATLRRTAVGPTAD
jgi:hypothetical protein